MKNNIDLLAKFSEEFNVALFYVIGVYPSEITLQGKFSSGLVSLLTKNYDCKFELSDTTSYVEGRFIFGGQHEYNTTVRVTLT